MLRRLLTVSAIAVSGFATAITVSLDEGSTASAAPVASPYQGAGVVVRVLDGDTLDVRLASGARERVRVLGIDSPELRSGECYAAQATAAARRFALGKRVRLDGDRTQATRDRYRRLLAYVRLPDGADLGRTLVAEGFAAVLVVNGRSFLRVVPYRSAEKVARDQRLGLWGCANVLPAGTPTPVQPVPPITPPLSTTSGTPPTETTADSTTTTATTTMPPVPICHISYPDLCYPPIAP